MKLFKSICTCLIVLTISFVAPCASSFADEDNYPIMPAGITKPFSKYAADYTTYTDGTYSYQVQFRVSGTYYHGVDSSGSAFASNVSVSSCTTGVNDNSGPQDGTYSVTVVNTTYYTSKSGNSVKIVVSSRVKETINGSAKYITHQHTFYLPWLVAFINQSLIGLDKHHYF